MVQQLHLLTKVQQLHLLTKVQQLHLLTKVQQLHLLTKVEVVVVAKIKEGEKSLLFYFSSI
jgi:hypothetical protein